MRDYKNYLPIKVWHINVTGVPTDDVPAYIDAAQQRMQCTDDDNGKYVEYFVPTRVGETRFEVHWPPCCSCSL